MSSPPSLPPRMPHPPGASPADPALAAAATSAADATAPYRALVVAPPPVPLPVAAAARDDDAAVHPIAAGGGTLDFVSLPLPRYPLNPPREAGGGGGRAGDAEGGEAAAAGFARGGGDGGGGEAGDGGTGGSGPTATIAGNDLAYLDMIERSLLESIGTLQAKLGEARKGSTGRSARGALRRPRGKAGAPAGSPRRFGGVPRGAGAPRFVAARRAGFLHDPAPRHHLLMGAQQGQFGGGLGGDAEGVASLGAGAAAAPPRQRIITVSLRLPTKADRESVRQQLFDQRLPPKGMFALENASDLPFVWVGAPDGSVVGSPSNPGVFEEVYGTLHNSTRLMEEPTENGQRQASHVVPVTLPQEVELMEAYYTFCNKTLWNILNYDYTSLATDDEMGNSEKHWNAYRCINQRFAEAVSEIYEEGDLIWVHNYHLMLLPSMLRQRLWYAKIGFFLYSPFPSAEIFRILPFRVEILKGVLGSDLVGFHTYDFSKQFAASCTRLLGLEGTPKGIEVEPRATRHCEFGIYPAGIDVRALKVCLNGKRVQNRIAALKRRFGNLKVIVGIDRLDDAFAGIPLKLLAFERFLADNEAWRGRVVLVQLALLPRQASKANEPHRAQINEFVARINSQYGTLASSPVHFVTEELEPAEIQSVMCVGHVFMVSAIRDGMGLRPYEWTVCQHGGYKGCIILSEFAGAAASFSTALHVNPWNVDDVSEKILEALQMKESERAMRDASAYAFVTTHTASLWGLNFLEDLEQADGGAEGPSAMSVPALDMQAVIDAYFGIKSSSMATPSSSSATILPFQVPTPPPSSTAEEHGNFRQSRSASHGGRMLPGTKDYSPAQTRSSSVALSILSPPMPTKPDPPWVVPTTAFAHFGITPLPLPTSAGVWLGNGSLGPKSAPVPRSRSLVEKGKKLFVLDYDGTLVSSQAIAELVRPSASILQLLMDLTELESSYVLLLSGRDRATLSRWFGHLDVFLAAEDGSFLRAPGGSEWVALFPRTADDDYGVRHVQDERVTSSMMIGCSPAFPAAEQSSQGAASESVMSPAFKYRSDCDFAEGDLEGGLPDGTLLPTAQAPLHPLLVGTARHKWSMSSIGSQNADVASAPPEWKAQVMPVMHHFAERTPGVILEEGDASLTWHYNDADAEFGRLQARDLLKHLESFLLQHLSIEVVSEEGSSRYPTRWVKVRPSGVDKSVAVERSLEWIRKRAEGSYSRSSSHNGVNKSSGLSSFALAAAAATAAFKAEQEAASAKKPMPSPPIKIGSHMASDVGTDSRENGLHGTNRPASWRGVERDGLSPSPPNGQPTRGSNDRPIVDFVLCVGDDRADEGMFDALGDESKLASMRLASVVTRVFTCRVGSGATSAGFVLESPQKLIDLLEEIVRLSDVAEKDDSVSPISRVPHYDSLEEKLQREMHAGSW